MVGQCDLYLIHTQELIGKNLCPNLFPNHVSSPDSQVADFKPKPSTPLDPGSSPRVSVTRKVSTLELETHPRKKRKIEGNGSPASDATGTRETQKAANDKPDVNGAKIAGSPLKPTETNDHLKPNGKGGKQPRKSNAPFQRIKAETIQFADERLKDNSFHSRVRYGRMIHSFHKADVLFPSGRKSWRLWRTSSYGFNCYARRWFS